MAFGIVTVLVGEYLVWVAAILMLNAALKGRLGQPQRKASSAEPTQVVTTLAPTAEPAVETPAEAAPTEAAAVEAAPVASETATTLMPVLYETVQPTPPAHAPYPTAPFASFGTTTSTRNPTRTYRRRPAPIRSASPFREPHSRPKKRVQ